MRYRYVLLLLVSFVFACPTLPGAWAQEPDVSLTRIGGTYNVCCMTADDNDLGVLCFARTDVTPPDPLACVMTPAGNTKVCKLLTIARTTFDDADIRCQAIDLELNESEWSENKGLVDFTPPGRPHIK